MYVQVTSIFDNSPICTVKSTSSFTVWIVLITSRIKLTLNPKCQASPVINYPDLFFFFVGRPQMDGKIYLL